MNHRTGNMKHTRLKTTDQHRTTEQLKQRLGNKMGGDRQLTREHMEPTTNNKPCAQHTDTSGGRSGHTIRTVKQPPPPPQREDYRRSTHKNRKKSRGVGRRQIWGRDGGPGPWSRSGTGGIGRAGGQGGASRVGRHRYGADSHHFRGEVS